MVWITRISPIVWLVMSAAMIGAGDYFSKKWAISPSLRGIIYTLVCYCCSSLCWLPALYQKNHLAILGTAWSVLATIATILVGVSVFGEVLEFHHWVGLVLALGAVGLLSY